MCPPCRIILEGEKRALADKAAKLAAQLADQGKLLDAARRAEAAAKREAERMVRGQLQPEQQKTGGQGAWLDAHMQRCVYK